MLLPALAVVVGVALLVLGAEALVRGASTLAGRVGIDPIIVGLTVVAVGTSAPELAIGVASAASGDPDLALGNVVGSNIANVLLVLGAAALVRPLAVALAMAKLDLPILVAASFAVWALVADGALSVREAVVLLVGFAAYLGWVVRRVRADRGAGVPTEAADDLAEAVEDLEAGAARRPVAVLAAMVVVGLVLLAGGSQLLVAGASEIASRLGASELVVGLTVVAVGTSLPELATSLLAARRGHADLAFGNLIGSNLLNLLLVLGATGVLAGGVAVSGSVLRRDLPAMVLAVCVLLLMTVDGFRIGRIDGGILLVGYVAYVAHLVLEAAAHRALVAVELGALVVVPIVVVAVGVGGYRGLRAGRT